MNKIQFLKREIDRIKDEMDSLLNSEIDTCAHKIIELGTQLDRLILEYINENEKGSGFHDC